MRHTDRLKLLRAHLDSALMLADAPADADVDSTDLVLLRVIRRMLIEAANTLDVASKQAKHPDGDPT